MAERPEVVAAAPVNDVERIAIPEWKRADLEGRSAWHAIRVWVAPGEGIPEAEWHQAIGAHLMTGYEEPPPLGAAHVAQYSFIYVSAARDALPVDEELPDDASEAVGYLRDGVIVLP